MSFVYLSCTVQILWHFQVIIEAILVISIFKNGGKKVTDKTLGRARTRALTALG